eukprot:6258325-Pyramimonas_sp.AAC.1
MKHSWRGSSPIRSQASKSAAIVSIAPRDGAGQTGAGGHGLTWELASMPQLPVLPHLSLDYAARACGETPNSSHNRGVRRVVHPCGAV